MARRILVIDDQRYIVELISQVLQDAGYQVQGCTDPRQAMEAVASFQPDGVMLDLMMPEIDGLTLLQALRRNPETERLPVLVCTAAVLGRSEMRLFRDMGIGVLPKPFDLEELTPSVERVIGPPQ
jgi:twitching motility two-component system response regulator PilH